MKSRNTLQVRCPPNRKIGRRRLQRADLLTAQVLSIVVCNGEKSRFFSKELTHWGNQGKIKKIIHECWAALARFGGSIRKGSVLHDATEYQCFAARCGFAAVRAAGMRSFAGCSQVEEIVSGVAATGEFPVEVNGVNIQSRPSRVVVLSPSLADVVLALG